MFNLIQAIYRAWQAGQIIRNPEKWKSLQDLGNQITVVVASVVSIVVFFFPAATDWLSQEVQTYVVGILVSGFGIANIVLTRITTRKEVSLSALVARTTEPEVPGRRVEDPKADSFPFVERRSGDSKDLGSAGRVGSGDRKVTPQGQDVI